MGSTSTIVATGDLEVDLHHTIEDVGIVLGTALADALGDKAGVRRFASALVPLDEALVQVALDLSGRPYLVYDVDPVSEWIGTFDPQLMEEFWRALSLAAGITLHIRSLSGKNGHHVIEASCKGVAAGVAGRGARGGHEHPFDEGHPLNGSEESIVTDGPTFDVLPAIDLRGGRCVRLHQGDFESETVYDDDPVRVAQEFEAAGARWIHLVDLDAARSGQREHLDEIRRGGRSCRVPTRGRRRRPQRRGGRRAARSRSGACRGGHCRGRDARARRRALP